MITTESARIELKASKYEHRVLSILGRWLRSMKLSLASVNLTRVRYREGMQVLYIAPLICF